MATQTSRLRTMISANRFFIFVAVVLSLIALFFAISARNKTSYYDAEINRFNKEIEKVKNAASDNQPSTGGGVGPNNPPAPLGDQNPYPNAGGQ